MRGEVKKGSLGDAKESRNKKKKSKSGVCKKRLDTHDGKKDCGGTGGGKTFGQLQSRDGLE